MQSYYFKHTITNTVAISWDVAALNYIYSHVLLSCLQPWNSPVRLVYSQFIPINLETKAIHRRWIQDSGYGCLC